MSLRKLASAAGLLVISQLLLVSPAGAALDEPHRVSDIRSGALGSDPFGLTSLGRDVMFRASEDTHGTELWGSDGSADGTVLLYDVNPGAPSSLPGTFTRLGDAVLFQAYEPKTGDELWRTDGTSGGTSQLRDIQLGPVSSQPRSLHALDGRAIFRADDGVNGTELWATDGTPAGTQMVLDINPGDSGVGGFFFPENFDGLAYFRAFAPASGAELWRSDGMPGGTTEIVKDLDPGASPADGAPLEITPAFEQIFFTATTPAWGRELWHSDGIPGGTTELVRDFDMAPTDSGVTALAAFDGRAYFRADGGGGFGAELWRSNGFLVGTERVSDINGGGSSNPSHLTPFGSWLYFTADDGIHGEALWRSDGIPGGTTEMVADINPCIFPEITPHRGKLYLCASDGIHGNELWRSDGIPGGTTEMVGDINPAGNSDPGNLAPHGDALYFHADDGSSGNEVWALDTTAPDTQLDSGPAPGQHIANPAPALGLSSGALDLARFECGVGGAFSTCATLGGGPFASGSLTGTPAAIPDGHRTLAVRAVDTHGNADPTPVTRSFTVDTTAPFLRIRSRRLRWNRRGRTRVRMQCPLTELTGPCRGVLRLKTRGRVRVGKRRKRRRVVLAKRRFSVGIGRRARGRVVRLRRGKRRLLTKRRRARRVVAIVHVRDRLGNRRRVAKRLVLRPKRSRRKRR